MSTNLIIGAIVAVVLVIGGVFFISHVNSQPQTSAVASVQATSSDQATSPVESTTTSSVSSNSAASTATLEAAGTLAIQNPFQAYYDVLPAGGAVQTCLKSGLGAQFTAAYNKGVVPVSAQALITNCSAPNPSMTGQDFLNEMPSAVQLCFKDALGSNLAAFLAQPLASFKETAEESTQAQNCPGVVGFAKLSTNLQQYILKGGHQ